jgi:aspartyl-tRNA(Asn)/glutamyl-tRNA(Gln) amidotransferase subunit B
MPTYEPVIGLETHIQLNTASKIFCSCSADSWDDEPNTNICPVCTGLPGVLPVLNKAAVEKAVLLAAAMHAAVRQESFFDRKNYFYPDLPKGYQISQYDRALASGGYMDVPVPAENGTAGSFRVTIHKLHLEEDAGKTKNERGRRLIDFNRCGVPLIEMVTGPDLRSADEAAQYLIRLRQLLRWLGVSEADMEKGHLRADANVSIRAAGSTDLNTKTEIKNVNSIEAVRSAINKEIERQIREVESGGRVEAWTLNWDDETQTLSKMRSKETEADYRYFREPDLLPLQVDDAWLETILADLPELPLERLKRFTADYGLPEYDANILTSERSLSDFYEEAIRVYGSDPEGSPDPSGSPDSKTVSNWMMNDVLRMLNDLGLTAADLKVTPEHLAEAIRLVDEKVVNTSTGKSLIPKVQETGKSPKAIVEAEGLGAVSDTDAIRAIVEGVVAENPDEAATYRAGKTSIIGWFVGQVMRASRGKADPQTAQALLKEILEK